MLSDGLGRPRMKRSVTSSEGGSSQLRIPYHLTYKNDGADGQKDEEWPHLTSYSRLRLKSTAGLPARGPGLYGLTKENAHGKAVPLAGAWPAVPALVIKASAPAASSQPRNLPFSGNHCSIAVRSAAGTSSRAAIPP